MLDKRYYEEVKPIVEKLLNTKGIEVVNNQLARSLKDIRNQIEKAKRDQKYCLEAFENGWKPTFKWHKNDKERYYNIENYKQRLQREVECYENRLETILLIAEELKLGVVAM